jgi:hypothetical protein
MGARAVWAASISVFLLLAGIELREAGVSLRVISEAKSYCSFPEYAKFIFIRQIPKEIEPKDAVFEGVNFLLSCYPNHWDRRASNSFWRDRSNVHLIDVLWMSRESGLAIETSYNWGGRTSAAIPNFNGNRQSFSGLQRPFKTHAINIQESALALNERPNVNEGHKAQYPSENSDPPSEPHHAIWIAKRSFSKANLRLFVFCATILLFCTSMMLLFGRHDSPTGNALGVLLFFGTPFLMLAALLWIG